MINLTGCLGKMAEVYYITLNDTLRVAVLLKYQTRGFLMIEYNLLSKLKKQLYFADTMLLILSFVFTVKFLSYLPILTTLYWKVRHHDRNPVILVKYMCHFFLNVSITTNSPENFHSILLFTLMKFW